MIKFHSADTCQKKSRQARAVSFIEKEFEVFLWPAAYSVVVFYCKNHVDCLQSVSVIRN